MLPAVETGLASPLRLGVGLAVHGMHKRTGGAGEQATDDARDGADQARQALEVRSMLGLLGRAVGLTHLPAFDPDACLALPTAQIAVMGPDPAVKPAASSAQPAAQPAAPAAKAVVEDLLGDFRPDYWVSDRYGGQMGFAKKDHQVCLAHLIRDVQYAIDAGDDVFAPDLRHLLGRACRIGRRRERQPALR